MNGSRGYKTPRPGNYSGSSSGCKGVVYRFVLGIRCPSGLFPAAVLGTIARKPCLAEIPREGLVGPATPAARSVVRERGIPNTGEYTIMILMKERWFEAGGQRMRDRRPNTRRNSDSTV